jgi:hypothetical protein
MINPPPPPDIPENIVAKKTTANTIAVFKTLMSITTIVAVIY